MDDQDDDLFESQEQDPQDGPDLFGEGEADPITPSADPDPLVTSALMDAVDARREPAVDIDRPETPLALYRRYRPDTFSEVIGQDHVTEPLQRALTNNRVNHAYLFSGPRGCGKTTSARILARCLNCAEGPTPTPCGVCQSCRDLARGGTGSIDVIEIDAASHGGVNEARDLRERAFFAPVHSRYKVYIIDEAHMVTKEGFNALLKVVEEPPPHVKFIFATTEPDKVLGTIRSRTHHYPFRLVPPRTLSAYLAELCEAEGIAVEPTVLPLVVRAGAGSVRDSLSVLDQLLGGAGSDGVTYRQATALLGYTPDALLDEIVSAFAASDAQGVFTAIDKVIETGHDPRRFAEDLLRRLRDLIIIAAVPDALTNGLIDVSGDQAERLTNQADALGTGQLTHAAEVIARSLVEMRGTTAPRLHLELMCARVLLPGADTSEVGLNARLDRLERRLNISASDQTPQPPSPPTVATSTPAAAARTARQPAPPTPAAADPIVSGKKDPWAAPGASNATQHATPEPSNSPISTTSEPSTQTPSNAATPTNPAEPAPVAPPKAAGAAPAAGGAVRDPASLNTSDLRRIWPQILDNVKNRRRFTWILLSQNAQVVEARQGALTLGLSNDGARESFTQGGSIDILRDALADVIGGSFQIETVVDATAEPTPPAAPAPTTAPPQRSEAAQRARDQVRTTRSANSPVPAEPEAEPSRNDVEITEDASSSEDLLRKHLGAELIDPS